MAGDTAYVSFPLLPIEGKRFYEPSPEEEKLLRRDKAFWRIWDGGLLQSVLTLKPMVAWDSDDHLILNGRRYQRSRYWFLPEILRKQGRLAREYPDARNHKPVITVWTQKGDALVLDGCPCGGELRIDHRDAIYCERCNIIYE